MQEEINIAARCRDLTARVNQLVAEKEAAQRQVKRWRWIAYLGICSFWLMLFTPQIVRAFFQYAIGRPV